MNRLCLKASHRRYCTQLVLDWRMRRFVNKMGRATWDTYASNLDWKFNAHSYTIFTALKDFSMQWSPTSGQSRHINFTLLLFVEDTVFVETRAVGHNSTQSENTKDILQHLQAGSSTLGKINAEERNTSRPWKSASKGSNKINDEQSVDS